MTPNKSPEEIFNKAVELSGPAEQVEYLEKACAGDEKLRAEVDALLKWHREAGDFLEVPEVDPNATLETSASPESSGTVIGRYKLLEKLGEGGMATVYMAEQKRPIRRRVALKIIKLGMDTKQVIGRFEAERQALAMMDHPNIAKVFDAGTTDTGRPYFVMELVRGLPITEFCDSNHLTTHERLDLFVPVCQAVQHAHQRGVIHRDIKPSNVLVTLHDGQAVAKVIDFGIAKAVNQQLTEKTVFTRYSQMIGTPEYMSPEQAEMSGLDIDTRTDVFSLGVLLYELLTGTTPFDAEYLLSKGYGEMQRIIREEEPIRPSTKISTLGEALTDIAKQRRTSPELLCKLIRTDLDWIVMKTLEKDRNRRYESVSELTADVQRHLDNEPVLAGRPSTVYRMHKFVKRNKILVSSAAVIAVILVFSSTVSLMQMVRANRAAKQEKTVSRELGIEKERAVKAEEGAKRERDRAKASERDARLNLYAADIIAVQKHLDDGNAGAARSLLQSHKNLNPDNDLRGWEWRHLWERARGDYQERLQGHEHSVLSVAFSPDGKLLASGDLGGDVIVQDAEGKVLFRYSTEAIQSVSFSNDGAFLAAGSQNGEVLVWDTGDFGIHWQFVEQGNGCAFVSFSPSDSVLAIGYASGLIKLWNYEVLGEVVSLGKPDADFPKEKVRDWAERFDCVLAFSPDGKYLAMFARSRDGSYVVLDMETQQQIAELEDFRGRPFESAQHVCFIPGKSTLFLGGMFNGSLLWDFKSNKTIVPIDGKAGYEIANAVFSTDGTLMATAGRDHALSLWEVSETSFRLTSRLLGHQAEAWCLAMSPDCKRVVSGGQHNEVLLWNTQPQEGQEVIQRSMHVCKPRFSRDGQLIALAVGEYPDYRTIFYDLEGASFLDFEVSGFPCGFTSDGAEIIVFRIDNSSLKHMKWNLAKSRSSWETDIGLAPGIPTALPVVCEKRNLLAEGWSDGSVLLIDYEDGKKRKLWKAHEGPVGILAFSPDGRLILTGNRPENAEDGSTIVWSCSDLDAIEPLYHIKGHQIFVFSAAFSPNGNILATGGADNRLILWDAKTGTKRQEFVGQMQAVSGLAFGPNDKTLVSSSGDGTIRIWHVATGRELLKFELESSTWSVSFSPDWNTLATISGRNPVYLEQLNIWRVPSLSDIEKSEEALLHGSLK